MYVMFGAFDELTLFTSHMPQSSLAAALRSQCGGDDEPSAAAANNDDVDDGLETFFVRVRWYGHEQTFATRVRREPSAADVNALEALANDAWQLVDGIRQQSRVVELLIDDELAPPCNVLRSAFLAADAPLPTELPLGCRLVRRSWRARHDVQVTVSATPTTS